MRSLKGLIKIKKKKKKLVEDLNMTIETHL